MALKHIPNPGLGPIHGPAFLVLQEDPVRRARITYALLAAGVGVFPVASGQPALAVLRQHNHRIVCVITDAEVAGPVSGHMGPYWFRFYNPFGPVIYVADDPDGLIDYIENSIVLNQSCGQG